MRKSPILARICRSSAIVLSILCLSAATSNAVVLLDDTWADGSRDEQNLPTESQWFSSGGTDNLTNVAAGSMTFIADPSSSAAAITYFATNGSPVALSDGETIKVTLDFSVTAVAENDDQSMRFALVDYSAGTRVDADGGSTGLNGQNVTGYGFFTHIGGPDFTLREILDIKERTDPSATDLIGASAAWTNQLADIWDLDFTPISNNVPYTMTISVTRSGDDALITNRLENSGWSIQTNAVHSNGWFNFDAFAFRNSGADQTAETFVFTRLLVEGPLGSPSPPAIVVQPQGLDRTLGQTANFTVGASGGLPLVYQWYYTTNSMDTLLVGATNAALVIPNLTFGDAGGYLAIVTNTLGAVTSEVATLVVNPSLPTPPGLVMCDDFTDGSRTNLPITASNSVWYASNASSLLVNPDELVGIATGTSRMWVNYFTDNPLLPVDLSVGNAIKISTVFIPTNVATWVTNETQQAVRIGLFDYADGGVRLDSDGFASGSGGNGVNVLGYMFGINLYETFTQDNPITINARFITLAPALLGSSSLYTEIGDGPGGMTGLPGFQDGVTYTNIITVARTGSAEVQLTCQMIGAGLDISATAIDDTWAVNRFDSWAMRVNRDFQSAEFFAFQKFQVEVLTSPVPFDITTVQSGGTDAVAITWDSIPGRTYEVQSTGSLLSPVTWTTNDTVVATGPSTTYTNSSLTATELFYGVVDVLP